MSDSPHIEEPDPEEPDTTPEARDAAVAALTEALVTSGKNRVGADYGAPLVLAALEANGWTLTTPDGATVAPPARCADQGGVGMTKRDLTMTLVWPAVPNIPSVGEIVTFEHRQYRVVARRVRTPTEDYRPPAGDDPGWMSPEIWSLEIEPLVVP